MVQAVQPFFYVLDFVFHVPEIVRNIEKIPEHTSQIPAMKEDTAAIRYDTKEIATKLWEKYEELSREISQMKITLARIEAKVF